MAEFVEDQATLQLLGRYGVDYAQGFYIAKPQPLDVLDLCRLPIRPVIRQVDGAPS